MGLFLRTCHQICHLSPSARFRQQINHPSVWPAVPFRCLPPLPAQPARSRLEGNPPEPSPVPRRLPCRSAPARQRLPPHPPCGGSRGGGGPGGGGAAGGAFPEGRGRAATCRRPPRGCAPLRWSPAAVARRPDGRRRCKRPPAAGNEIRPPAPFRYKIPFFFDAAPPTTRAVAGAAPAAGARHQGGGGGGAWWHRSQNQPGRRDPPTRAGVTGERLSRPSKATAWVKRRGRGGRWRPGESGAMLGSPRAAWEEEEDNP